jgi:hypothetical protein
VARGEARLNPPEWVGRVPEVVPGIMAKNNEAAKKLKERTLTKLHNEPA